MRACAFKGCAEPIRAKWYCAYHYDQLKRRIISPAVPPAEPCRYCGRPLPNDRHARQRFCGQPCMSQWYYEKGGESAATGRRCDYEGCTRPHYGKGYCRRHYRWAHEAKSGMRPRVCRNCGDTLSPDARIDSDFCDLSCKMCWHRIEGTYSTLGLPKWQDKEKIKAILIQAIKRGKADGRRYHVDHVIPRNGRLVCGLDIHQNMAIITDDANRRKHNRFNEADCHAAETALMEFLRSEHHAL